MPYSTASRWEEQLNSKLMAWSWYLSSSPPGCAGAWIPYHHVIPSVIHILLSTIPSVLLISVTCTVTIVVWELFAFSQMKWKVRQLSILLKFLGTEHLLPLSEFESGGSGIWDQSALWTFARLLVTQKTASSHLSASACFSQLKLRTIRLYQVWHGLTMVGASVIQPLCSDSGPCIAASTDWIGILIELSRQFKVRQWTCARRKATCSAPV